MPARSVSGLALRALTLWMAVAVPTFALANWTGEPSPLDGKHLVVLQAAQATDASGNGIAAKKDPLAVFGQQVPVDAAGIVVPVKVQHAGKYQIWIRLGASADQAASVKAQLRSADGKFVAEEVLSRDGKTLSGGPAGYAAYQQETRKHGPAAKFDNLQIAGSKPGDLAGAKTAASEFEKELLDDLAKEQGTYQKSWALPNRLEELDNARPFYWYRLAVETLPAGEYQLQLASAGKSLVAFDAGLLSTSEELVYPYRGDIEAVPASYVRFRIDALPESGTTITAGLRIHYDPFSTPRVSLNPGGLDFGEPKHMEQGFTRWYRLQDIERAPGFGRAQTHLTLTVDGVTDTANSPVRGATQFAVYPHDDFVLREISWNQPEGLRISMATDFASHLDQLRTIRDHARENYEKALAATGEAIFPLTRDGLYFGNSWGAANGAAGEYMAKTLRLLGFNSVGDSSDPVGNRERFAWSSQGGHYWPPARLPFDEKAAYEFYDQYYRDYFTKRRDFYEGMSIFQMADEPNEISTQAMSSPLWRFMEQPAIAGQKPTRKFVDVSGGSMLATRKVDYQDCVLEGQVERHGNWFGFRVAMDHATEPTRYADWRLGQVSVNREINLATTRVGIDGATSQATRPGAAIGTKPTPFKIIYEQGNAELFIAGKRIHQHTNLPKSGGFAIVGPPKAISELRIRPINDDEHIVAAQPSVKIAGGGKPGGLDLDVDDLLNDVASGGKTAKALPFEETIQKEWIVGGGMPEAHAGFRVWAKQQGLTPSEFGQKTWDEVRMLTVAELVSSPAEARLFYWSRRYAGYLTPKMFAMATDAMARNAPNPQMRGFVALSGHSLYFPSAMPLDMFELANQSSHMLPGVSDWMSYGSWRWDSHQAVAFSVAPFNAGARRYDGSERKNFPMMHCVWPSAFRSYTMLANNVKFVSYFNYGPSYAVTEGYWSENPGSYHAVHQTNNRAAQVDDLLAQAQARPSRVAMLYSHANEYWNPQTSFADKRATFLALSHEYYQPELVTEQQVADGALAHYDALYVLDPLIASMAKEKITTWVRSGGLLWMCADAGIKNEFNEPADLLTELGGIQRGWKEAVDPKQKTEPIEIRAEEADLLTPHTVRANGIPDSLQPGSAQVRAKYADGRAAWLEQDVDQGHVVYLGHRAGLTYTSKTVRLGGYPVLWADTGREVLVRPLHERQVSRELVLSEPIVVAAPLSTKEGTVVVLYNMRPNSLQDLKLTLREAAAPHSIQTFDGNRLVDVPFTFADGRVEFTLTSLDGPQLVSVRRNAPAEDPRLSQEQQRVTVQLQSDDPKTLAAAAWRAGFFPAWQLGPKLIGLLEHPHWDVRRSVAESLGRLGDESAVMPLKRLVEVEDDEHVLGDALVALGKLHAAGLPQALPKAMQHPSAWVQQQALRAAMAWTAQASAEEAAELAKTLTADAWRSNDARVRQAAIELTAASAPELLAERAFEVFAEPENPDRAAYAAAIANHKAAMSKLAAAGEMSNELLLEVARRRKDANLAKRVLAQAGKALNWDQVLPVALTQRDAELTKALFAQRAKLPEAQQRTLALLLEYTFDARLGNDLAAWEAYLAK